LLPRLGSGGKNDSSDSGTLLDNHRNDLRQPVRSGRVLSGRALCLYFALPLGLLPMWIEPMAFVTEIAAALAGVIAGGLALYRRHWDAIA